MSDFELAAQPHDAFFKQTFSDPHRAAALFQHHLPAKVSDGVKWSTLTLVPGSFVKQDLQQTHSDLLFRVEAQGRDLRLYLLFEHQTSPDSRMPLRMLGYILEILKSHDEKHGLPLPPVIGFVLHQGPDRWTVSEKFEDMFALPPELLESVGQYLPRFSHALLDLTQYDPKCEEDDAQLRAALELMKLARQKDLISFFEWLVNWTRVMQDLPKEFLRQLLMYAVQTEGALDVETLSHKLRGNPELQGTAMSLAETLIRQGRKEGRNEGRQEGRQEGRGEGIWIGKIQLLQEIMNLPVTPGAVLAEVEISELQSQHAALQKAYAGFLRRD